MLELATLYGGELTLSTAPIGGLHAELVLPPAREGDPRFPRLISLETWTTAPASRTVASQGNQSTKRNKTNVRNPEESVVEWIRSAAIPLAGVEPQQGCKDLEPLRAIIGDARIVSLGEATHGTREFFKLKHRLLEFLVAELGFTVFVIEANFPESLAVNAYVLDGVGTAADALAGMRFWIWDTEEVLDLIEWMRWWNANNTHKVKFYGFTMSYPAVAAMGLIDFLERVAPELAAASRTELAPLTSDFTAQLFGQLPDARRAAVLACIARVLAVFAEQRPQWIAATSVIDWHLGRLHAVVLDQGARFEVKRSMAVHERVVAENVCALLEAEGPGAKAVLWSHNSHAARSTDPDGRKSMGKNIDEMVGRAQVVVGFSFDRGSFQARTYPSGELTDHSVAAAVPNSFDSALAQAGLPVFALDLSNAPREGKAAAWLASEIPMRSIGGIYGFPKDNKYGVTYADAITPREHFDAVVFVAETTAARRNRASLPTPNSVPLPALSNLKLSGDGVPAGWRVVGGDRKYVPAIAVSDEPSPRGGRTVCVSRAAPWRWGDSQLIQRISAQAWQGKRLRFSAAVRTVAKGVGAGALLFVKLLPKSDDAESNFFLTAIATAVSAEQPVQSPQWGTFAVEADVPEAADSFTIGLAMTGNGAAWFGDLELAAVMRSD
jgi:erythromycin esterase